MSATAVTVAGVVTPDGTLEVPERVNLPAGPVQVQVQLTIVPPTEDWWQYLQRCRAELKASGATFRQSVDIAAEVEQIRSEHDRLAGIYWEQGWEKHHPETGSC
jgi:hypothetical protein